MGGSGHPVYPRRLPASAAAAAAHASLSPTRRAALPALRRRCRSGGWRGACVVTVKQLDEFCRSLLFYCCWAFFGGGNTKLGPRGPRVTTYHSSLLLKPLTIKNLPEAEWRAALCSPALEQLSEQPHNHRGVRVAVARPAQSTFFADFWWFLNHRVPQNHVSLHTCQQLPALDGRKRVLKRPWWEGAGWVSEQISACWQNTYLALCWTNDRCSGTNTPLICVPKYRCWCKKKNPLLRAQTWSSHLSVQASKTLSLWKPGICLLMRRKMRRKEY